jgi:hypothetical protein
MINILKLCLSTCGTLILSVASASAATISGSFRNDPISVPAFGIAVPEVTTNFTVDTLTNIGTVSGINPFTQLNDSFAINTTGSTFNPVTNLFNEIAISFILDLRPTIPLPISALGSTNFGGLQSGINRPFTVSLPGFAQPIEGNISSFNQQISQVPFEFSPVAGLAIVGGLIAAKKLVKVKKAS